MGQVTVSTGIDEQSQRGAFQNATLQSVGAMAASIAAYVKLPSAVAAHGGRAVAMLLVTELGAAVRAAPELSFDVQVELKASAAEGDQDAVKPQRVAGPKGVSLLLGVSEDDQRCSFENATLQGSGVSAFSVATRINIPVDVAEQGDDEVTEFIGKVLTTAIKASPALSFDVQIGPSSEPDFARARSLPSASPPALAF
jgi:hypothetical protein